MQEFAEAWKYFEELLVEESRARVGLDTITIIITMTVLVVLMLMTFVFIFLGMAAHEGQNDFASVIRSISIIFMGGLTSYLKPYHNKMKDPNQMKDSVQSQVSEFAGFVE